MSSRWAYRKTGSFLISLPSFCFAPAFFTGPHTFPLRKERKAGKSKEQAFSSPLRGPSPQASRRLRHKSPHPCGVSSTWVTSRQGMSCSPSDPVRSRPKSQKAKCTFFPSCFSSGSGSTTQADASPIGPHKKPAKPKRHKSSPGCPLSGQTARPSPPAPGPRPSRPCGTPDETGENRLFASSNTVSGSKRSPTEKGAPASYLRSSRGTLSNSLMKPVMNSPTFWSISWPHSSVASLGSSGPNQPEGVAEPKWRCTVTSMP